MRIGGSERPTNGLRDLGTTDGDDVQRRTVASQQ